MIILVLLSRVQVFLRAITSYVAHFPTTETNCPWGSLPSTKLSYDGPLFYLHYSLGLPHSWPGVLVSLAFTGLGGPQGNLAGLTTMAWIRVKPFCLTHLPIIPAAPWWSIMAFSFVASVTAGPEWTLSWLTGSLPSLRLVILELLLLGSLLELCSSCCCWPRTLIRRAPCSPCLQRLVQISHFWYHM